MSNSSASPAARTARWQAPGRVNVIGEHTDYSGGFALPFALPLVCTAEVTVDGSDVVIRSAQRAEPVTLAADHLRPGSGGWAGYAAGVVWALRQRGVAVPGLRIELDSAVPAGAGLSSSAALACAVATAVNDVLELGLPLAEVLAVTRSTENDFVGAPTGGMDQMAALYATAGHALFCDMRALSTEQVPFEIDAAGLSVLVVDSHAAHAHADGEYGQRRAGCERAARELRVESLRDLSSERLAEALDRLDDDELRRYTRHVVTENARVLDTVAALRAADYQRVGELLVASHASLRDDYRVSVEELDVAVDALLATGALGARMTGGGFGGSVIALLDEQLVPAATAAVVRAYAVRNFRPPTAMTATAAGGARRV